MFFCECGGVRLTSRIFLTLHSFVKMDFLSIECLQKNYLNGVLVSATFPILLATLNWAGWSLRYCAELTTGLFDHEDSLEARERIWADHMQAFLLIIYLFVPVVSNILFKVHLG